MHLTDEHVLAEAAEEVCGREGAPFPTSGKEPRVLVASGATASTEGPVGMDPEVPAEGTRAGGAECTRRFPLAPSQCTGRSEGTSMKVFFTFQDDEISDGLSAGCWGGMPSRTGDESMAGMECRSEECLNVGALP
jgi:hypothetical protein